METKDKFFFTKTTAAAIISTFLLTGCNDEVQVSNNGNKEARTEKVETEDYRGTTFSTGGDVETRSSLDKDLNFYWTPNDNIFVDIGGTYIQNTSSNITTQTRQADFFFRNTKLDAPSYNVFYTGSHNLRADTVTIATSQQQDGGWNNSAHIGRYGDCGMAKARPTGGVYTFTL